MHVDELPVDSVAGQPNRLPGMLFVHVLLQMILSHSMRRGAGISAVRKRATDWMIESVAARGTDDDRVSLPKKRGCRGRGTTAVLRPNSICDMHTWQADCDIVSMQSQASTMG